MDRQPLTARSFAIRKRGPMRKSIPQSDMDGNMARSAIQLAARGWRLPENALTGTLFTVNVEPRHGLHGGSRLLRSTPILAEYQCCHVTPGQIAIFATGTLGYEWNEAPNEGAPPGLMRLSSRQSATSRESRITETIFPPGSRQLIVSPSIATAVARLYSARALFSGPGDWMICTMAREVLVPVRRSSSATSFDKIGSDSRLQPGGATQPR